MAIGTGRTKGVIANATVLTTEIVVEIVAEIGRAIGRTRDAGQRSDPAIVGMPGGAMTDATIG